LDVRNRVALITGASTGIGAATARALAEAGCCVVLVARSGEALAALAEEIRARGGEALPLAGDVTRRSAVEAIVTQTVGTVGHLDILVNNAGIGLHQSPLTASWADVQRLMAVNWYGPLAFIRAAVPPMREAGGGLIVNVCSILGRRAVPRSGIYCASKAALERLGDSLRLDLAADNIRVVTVYPGVTDTGFNQHTLDAGTGLRAGRMRGIPPERVARTIVRAIRREPRDAYATLFDYAFVTFSTLMPRVADIILRRYFASRTQP
jgi:short-subunit dehydrogenase